MKALAVITALERKVASERKCLSMYEAAIDSVDRAMVTAHENGWSYEAIATHAGVTRQNVGQRIRRARAKDELGQPVA